MKHLYVSSVVLCLVTCLITGLRCKDFDGNVTYQEETAFFAESRNKEAGKNPGFFIGLPLHEAEAKMTYSWFLLAFLWAFFASLYIISIA